MDEIKKGEMVNYDAITSIDKITKDLEFCIGVVYDALKTQNSVSLNNSDIFKSINVDIDMLKKYKKNYLGQVGVFYTFALGHLNNTFCNKDVINSSEIDKVLSCLNDIKRLKKEINKNSLYNKYFEDLKGVSRNLSSINNDLFLRDSNSTKNYLETYEKVLIKYEKLISNINELRSEMSNDDFECLKLDLSINFSALKANINGIYKEILKSNIDIAGPIMNKLNREVNSNNYSSILNTSMVNKVVNDSKRRKILVGNFEMLISSMDKIVDRYKDCKVNKNSIKIDVEMSDEGKREDYDIDIPQFIEDNYNEKRKNSINVDDKDNYDKKLNKLITRFEILKRKLERIEKEKGSLPKEEVILYNRLESELDELKNGKKNTIKFNYYYNRLKNKIKLYKNNSYQLVKEDNKKRK